MWRIVHGLSYNLLSVHDIETLLAARINLTTTEVEIFTTNPIVVCYFLIIDFLYAVGKFLGCLG